MDKKRAKILDGTVKLFLKYGIKSVNMDDVARHLGISKKTLYQFVKDKNDLVHQTISHHQNLEDAGISGICNRGLNAIDESYEIMKFILSILKDVHPSVIFDLEKYHPEVAMEMQTKRHGVVFECINSNLEKGKREGLYRQNLNSEIIARIYITRMENIIFDPHLFEGDKYSPAQVYLEMFRYHIRGLASEQGILYLREKIKQEEQKIQNVA